MEGEHLIHSWCSIASSLNITRGCKDRWRSVMTGSVGACWQFWESVRDMKYLARHPDLAPETYARTLPIGIHGDGGAFSKQENLLTISWNSSVGTGCTIEKRFLFTVILKSYMVLTPSSCMRDTEISSGQGAKLFQCFKIVSKDFAWNI